ncbi:efflux RND transporter permease subunit [bacterium]|nr:efflux RND transporter permease subunit [bacterium]
MTLGELVGRNRTAILGLTALLTVAGAIAAWAMPVAIFPEVAFHRITLIARAGDLPVAQTVTALTKPLENAVTTVPRVRTIRSLTTRGGSQLDLVFEWGSDMAGALQAVLGVADETVSELPPGTQFEGRLLDTSAFPIVSVALSASRRTLGELSDLAIYEVAPQMRTIPGVYRVDLDNAKIREYAITVDPAALAAHRLDLGAVEDAVRDGTTIAGAGQGVDGHELTLAVVRGPAAEPAALGDIVVATRDAATVPLAAVATVAPALREDFTRAAVEGEPAVLLGISRQPDGNAVAIAAAVRAHLAALARTHPDIRFRIVYDQADLVQEAIASVRDSIGVGLLLAVATLFFFIADLRATAVAAAVIPATVLISCLPLHVLGLSFNLMTLGGIAAGIGLILDDAIVVVENVSRHRAAGQSGEQATRRSLGEITHALLGSTLTPVLVLLPLGLLGGVPGAFFRPLAVTMSVSLLVSLGLALTFTPALADALAPRRARPMRHGPGDRLAAALSLLYARGLHWTLRHRAAAVGFGALLLAVSILAYQRIDSGFVPAMDEGAFVLDYWAPPGAALAETERMLDQVDAVLRDTPEVATFARRTGAELGFFLTASNRGDYSVQLRRQRRRSSEAVIEDVRERVEGQVPGLRVEFVQVLQDMIGDLSGNPSPIEIKLLGDDPAALRALAPQVAARISPIPGVVDEFDGVTAVGPTYDVDVDARRAALAGIDAAGVQRWLATAVSGSIVGQVLEGDRAIPLRVRYPLALQQRLRSLDGVTLTTPDGRLAPLTDIAHLRPGRVEVQHERENLRPVLRVTARLEGRDLGSATTAVRRALADVALPPGVSVELGGLYASQQEAFAQLVLVFAAAVAGVAALLLVEFGSVAAAAAIVLGSAMALSGSLLALWLSGTALNVSSVVGIIMVVGIVAKNGILLLDFAGRAEARLGRRDVALIEAGRVRLRPILMTTLAALAGLAPLALGIGAGAQMQQPLAIAILGGITVSMFCSLIGIPLLYILLSPRAAAARHHAPAGG